MAANLIYTFSYGSIGSCHVCTTWAVCLCVLALYGHCAWDRPGPSDIFSAENIRSRSTSRKRRMHFNSISTKQTEAHASKYSSQSHGHALYCLVCTIIQPDMEIKSDSPMGTWCHCVNYLKVSRWLLIRGIIPVKPTAAYPNRNNIMPRREGPWINISPALQSDTALQAL